jgi:hypothetical protein
VVKALRYKPEATFRFGEATFRFGVDSASNRNKYQEYFLGIKAAGA